MNRIVVLSTSILFATTAIGQQTGGATPIPQNLNCTLAIYAESGVSKPLAKTFELTDDTVVKPQPSVQHPIWTYSIYLDKEGNSVEEADSNWVAFFSVTEEEVVAGGKGRAVGLTFMGENGKEWHIQSTGQLTKKARDPYDVPNLVRLTFNGLPDDFLKIKEEGKTGSVFSFNFQCSLKED